MDSARATRLEPYALVNFQWVTFPNRAENRLATQGVEFVGMSSADMDQSRKERKASQASRASFSMVGNSRRRASRSPAFPAASIA